VSAKALADPVIWHDVECGAYTADLELWEELAASEGGPVLELGCGTGRVAGHLAARGHAVTGVDRDPALIAALEERAGAGGHPVEAVCGDVRELQLDGRFALAIAPMQLAHLLESAPQRRRMLLSVRRHLEPDGLAAFALLEHETLAVGEAERGAMLPDARERDGWIFSSLPLSVRDHAEGVELRRLRQAVSPAGELTEEVDVTWLTVLPAEQLEAEASSVGLWPAGRRDLPPTDAHAGSVVVLLRPHHGPGQEERR
jgi:SAM-dependent methyltransferase